MQGKIFLFISSFFEISNNLEENVSENFILIENFMKNVLNITSEFEIEKLRRARQGGARPPWTRRLSSSSLNTYLSDFKTYCCVKISNFLLNILLLL